MARLLCADAAGARRAGAVLAALGGAVFAALALAIPFQPELNPDTASYLALSPSRPPAYGLILHVWAALTGGLGGLPQLQMAALVWGTAALAAATARRTRSLALGLGVFVATLLPSDLRYWAVVAMSETFFTAAIMAMLAAALGIDAARPLPGLLRAGAWAACAIALRNAGLPLAVALAILGAMLARVERRPALPLLAAATLPILLALAASASVHLGVNGKLTPGSWSGVSLAGKGMMLTRPGDEAWLPPPLRAAPGLAVGARDLPPGMPALLRMRVRYTQYDAIRFHHLWPQLAQAGITDPMQIDALIGPAAWRAIRQDPAGYAWLAAGDWAALWMVPNKMTAAERDADIAFLDAHPVKLLDMGREAVIGMLVPLADRPVAVWLRRVGALGAFVASIMAIGIALCRTRRRRPPGLAGPALLASLSIQGSFVAIAAVEGGLGRYAVTLWPAQVLLCALAMAWLAARVAAPPPSADQRRG